MTERESLRKIKSAFENATPNVLNSVLKECESQERKVISMTKKSNLSKVFIGLAAALVIVLGGVLSITLYQNTNAIATTVSIDVNPSVEIQINKNDRVIDVKALNEDGKTVIGDMNFKGSDLKVTVNALIGSMVREGFINELANSILISVDNSDPEKSAAIQRELSAIADNLLKKENFSGAVVSQTIDHNHHCESEAKEYGISEGKAQLINEILKNHQNYDFEDLAKLNITELNLLADTEKTSSSPVDFIGTPSEEKYIGYDAALQKALENAGLSATDVYGIEREFDFERGVMVYEIEFKTADTEYSYDINAITGEVVKKETERNDDRYDYDDHHDDDHHDYDHHDYDDDWDDRYDDDDDDDWDD